ncbi:MAG: TonB family protein [Myxococcales bacterium]|nr:TonB family protein [Myxococcales bacterium]
MFESLENVSRGTDRKTWFATSVAATLLFGTLGGTALWLLGQKTEIVKETEVEVTFVPRAEPAAVPEPEPPPPPPPAARAPIAAAVAPVAAPGAALTPPSGPVSQRRAFQAPKRIPTAAPMAVDPVRVETVAAVIPAPDATPTPEPAPVTPPAPKEVAPAAETAPRGNAGPVATPEDFESPRAALGNRRPDYPQNALSDGREGEVVIELRIRTDGSVTVARVVSGEEPFASAALDAVKTWRYQPARVSGMPIEVARRVRLPFKVRG